MSTKPTQLAWEVVEQEQAERRERLGRLKAWSLNWGCSINRLAHLINVNQSVLRYWIAGRHQCTKPKVLIYWTRAVEAQWRAAHPGQPDPGSVFYTRPKP